MKVRNILIASIMLLAFAVDAMGAITAEEAKQLGTTLTAIGAEKAGNKDGSIPEFTGGLATIPPGITFKLGSGQRPDPFADEKPLFTITQKNKDKYLDKLTAAQKTLFQKYPDFRMDVYKTHRTVTYPKWVLENTIKQAGKAKLLNDGITLTGVKGAFPFPIPKNGSELIWNHLLHMGPPTIVQIVDAWVVNVNGRKTLASTCEETVNTRYWDPSATQAQVDEVSGRLKYITLAPPRNVGEQIMASGVLDNKKGSKAYVYLPGQRRVKLAPDYAFDTPNTQVNGLITVDQWTLFTGSPERFNWNLIGKKEMYIPYNCYQLVYWSKKDKLFTAKYLNPDYVRWELHRVWVLEADLKPGKRHIFKKRIFYVDEDSWSICASEEYDARGELNRGGLMMMVQNYDYPTSHVTNYVLYDFNANAYTMDEYIAENGGVKYIKNLPENLWNPESMAGTGIR
jgi:hypothetical protein